jgi:hypothetical protein
MSDDKQPNQKVTGDMMFVIIVVMLECFVTVFGVATEDLWILVPGLLISPIAFRLRRIYRRKRGSD